MRSFKFISFLTFFLFLQQKQAVFAQNACAEGSGSLYSDTLDVVHYGIHLDNVNLTSKTIQGYTEVRCISKLGSLNSIKLELINMTVDSVFAGNTKINGFIHSGAELLIPLPSPLNPGETLTTTVYYHGKPFVDPSGWGGFQFYGEYAFNLGVGFDAIPHNLGKAWFPCLDDFHDRALYDVYIRVPDSYKAVSGGLLAEVQNNGDNSRTWHWKTSYSLPTYLISASIGKYSLIEDHFDGISGAVPVTFYCRSADSGRVAGTFVHMKEILRHYESHFGPYPFERVGYTATAQGAMEHASNISYPYSGWTGNTSGEWWYAHELSHMWFGNMVTCASAEDMWLNEGWAVWCEMLFMEDVYGKEAARDYTRTKLKEVLQFAHTSDGGYYALYGIPQVITYGKTVYEKGGQVTHTLRHYLGDSLFFNGIKAYLQHFKFNYATTCDLRDFLSSTTGVDLNDFFEAWVFTPGFPHFSVGSMEVIPVGNSFDVQVNLRQKLKGTNHYANSNHLELTFFGSGWQQYSDTVIFSGKTGSKTFHLPFKPVEVMADFHEQISDAAIKNSRVIKSAGEMDFPETYCKVITSSIIDSALVRIVHNWVAPDSLKSQKPGLRLSDSRYWKVEAVFGGGFSAKGKFFYSKSNNLDNTLLTGAHDSIVMLYRPDVRFDWRGIGFSRQGTSTIGYIICDSLLRGEYTLAVWDKTFSRNTPEKKKDSRLRVFPNPAGERCTIEVDSPLNTELGIYSPAGSMVQEFSFTAGKHILDWSRRNLNPGMYHFRLHSKTSEIAHEKVILN